MEGVDSVLERHNNIQFDQHIDDFTGAVTGTEKWVDIKFIAFALDLAQMLEGRLGVGARAGQSGAHCDHQEPCREAGSTNGVLAGKVTNVVRHLGVDATQGKPRTTKRGGWSESAASEP